jgi:hypothetical protein
MARNQSRHPYRATAVVLALALAAAGCGGGDDEAGADKTTTTSDRPTTTVAEDREPSGAGAAVSGGAGILTVDGAAAALEEAGGNSIVGALGFPESMASIEGKIHNVYSNYNAPGTTDRVPGADYTIEVAQQKPLEQATADIRDHFTAAGFTFGPPTAGDDLSAQDATGEDSLGIVLEDAGDGATLVKASYIHSPPDGAGVDLAGDLFAFVENLRFDDAMVLANATVTLDSGRDDEFGAVDPTLSFSVIYEVETGGYDDAEAALERVCAGEVDGYSCGEELGPTFDGDGVQANDFEAPDRQPFDVILSDAGDGSDAPSFLFTFTGGGFPEE